MRLSVAVAASCVLMIGLSAAGEVHAAIRKQMSIPAQGLGPALQQLARDHDVQLVYRSEVVGDQRTDGAAGELTLDEALEMLLFGTGLKFKYLGEGALMIVPAGTSTSLLSPAGGKLRMFSGGSALAPESDAASDTQTQTAGAANDASASAGAAGQESAPLDSETRATRLNEIVVTAQKREERLIDAPQAVSVLTGDVLTKLGATQFRDFASVVPGLSYITAGAGNTQVSLRGVTIGQDLGATVGIYIDETPYGSSAVFAFGPYLALDVGLFDIARIEVLRGPQGTLYGASTMGGLIKYVTKAPDTEEFSGIVEAGVSSTSEGDVNYTVAAVANIPLASNRAALRANGFQSRDGGYIDNIAHDREDVNQADVHGGRLDLLLTPSEDLDVRITGFAQDIDRDGEVTADYQFSGAMPIGELKQNRIFDEPFDQQFRLVSATIGYDFGATSLTSISTYQTALTKLTWDLSAVYAPLFNSFGLGPFGAVGNPNRSDVEKFSHETRLNSTGGDRLEWVMGAFYTSEKAELATELLLQDLDGNPVPNELFTYRAPTEFEEYAIFGDLTVRLGEQFDVTGGIRYAHNDQEFTQFGSGLLGANVPTRRSDEENVTYLGTARYYINDLATAYVRYATGYRPGGPNIVTAAGGDPTFDSDELASYEAGIKAESADRRFAIDLAGYFIDWDNIQISVNIGGFTGYDNAPGGAEVRGAELSVSSQPTARLNLSGAVAWQDAELSEADPSLGGAKGERLPNVPQLMASLNADYEFPGSNLSPTLGATVRYIGERRSSFDNSTSFPQYRLPSYSTVDVRAGITNGDLNAQLFVHNVLDERGQQSVFFPQFGARVAILQPRTYGISVTKRF